MRRKLKLLLGTLVFMVAITAMLDAGAVGAPHSVARADGVCVFVDPIPGVWQGGYVCTP